MSKSTWSEVCLALMVVRAFTHEDMRGRDVWIYSACPSQGELTDGEFAPIREAWDAQRKGYEDEDLRGKPEYLRYVVSYGLTPVAWMQYDRIPRLVERSFTGRAEMIRLAAAEFLGQGKWNQARLRNSRGDA
ncbi:hypothetical protein ACFU7T_12095 [Streptomyces sp. NPDC057555]|uniref:hypothetical protein n=1 Tax=Streptomyces sp. NPDC057555 TaxID=3346166 RepID=UPI0036B56580